MRTTTNGGDTALATELFDRYVREVGRHLPRRRRGDVMAELQTLLRDQLDDRLEERPDARAEELAAEVLRELGPPDRVARSYAPPGDVWIGPELYPAFRATAFVVLLVYSILTGLWALGGFSGSISLLPFHLEFDASRDWADILLGAIANVGVVCLLFGIIERIARRSRSAAVGWDPHKLPRIEDPDRITVAGEIAGLSFTALFALIFNFAPEWLGLFVFRGDEWGPFAVLAPEYRVHLPWMNLWWAAAFALHLGVVLQGRWRTWSRVAEFALGLFGAWVLYRIVIGGPFTFLDVLAKPVLVLAIAVTLVVSVVRAVRLARRLADRVLEPAPQS